MIDIFMMAGELLFNEKINAIMNIARIADFYQEENL